jgi:membrane protease subunit (stomatin/prohibitin family)
MPFGGTSPFQSEVYFVSLKVFTNQHWGTAEPILFRDTDFTMVRLRAYGIFSVRVVDAQLFVNKVVGTANVYTSDALQDFFRNIIVARLNNLLGENVKSILDLPKYYDALGAAAKARVKDDFAQYGVELIDFLINAITPPDDVQKIIDERTGMGVVGNMGQYMQFKAAKSLEEAAQNPGGSAGSAAGLGMGLGLGMQMPGMINQAMQQAAAQASQAQTGGAAAAQTATIACAKCQSQIPAGAKFCPNCGAQVVVQGQCPNCHAQNAPGAKFCSNCGAKLA